MNDIIRLGQELKWKPGDCAYCNGGGKVDSDIIGKVPVNEIYLATNLPPAERRKLFELDKKALDRAREFNIQVDAWVQRIRELHFEQELSADQITDWMIATYPQALNGKRISEGREEILCYVKKVIYQRN